MRLRDIVADLRGELQRGVDVSLDDREDGAGGPRLDVRRVDVELPAAVTATENDNSDGSTARLDVRPGEGDARFTFRFAPGAAFEDATDPSDGAAIEEGSDEERKGGSDPIIPDTSADEEREGAAAPVTTVEDIGPKRAAALAGLDVTTVGDLAAADPAAVADELATAEGQARRFVARARFVALGADAQTADLLVDRELDREAVAAMDPSVLRDELRDAAGESTLVPEDYDASLDTLERVVERAGEQRD